MKIKVIYKSPDEGGYTIHSPVFPNCIGKGKTWFLLLLYLLLVVGCSPPSEKNIEKAVVKGDYQYIENYIANPKYWDNPNQAATNAAAVEALILLNRIDAAASLYEKNKGKPKEEMIVNAFVNALIKSKSQKMPEKLVKLIDDDRNENSDALLRKTAVEIESALATSKIKQYADKAINNRQTLKKRDAHIYKESLSKALLWDVKGIFAEPLNLVIQQYSKLEDMEHKKRDIEQNIESERKNLKSYEQGVENSQKDINDLYSRNPYNLMVEVCLKLGVAAAYARGGGNPRAYCLESLEKGLQNNKTDLNNSKVKLEKAIIELKSIEKTIAGEIAKTQLIEEKLNATLKE